MIKRNNYDKKGQVTIYIIIGIILVLVIGALFLFRPNITKVEEAIEVPLELIPVKDYVDDCLRQTALSSVYLLGIQGGYIFPPSGSLETDFSTIAYGYNLGKDNLVSISKMEEELSTYIGFGLPDCINFSVLEQEGFNITQEKIEVETNVNYDNIIFEVKYPLEIVKEDYSSKLDKFIQIVPIRLGYVHSVAKDIIKKNVNNPNWIDLTYLSSIGLEVNIIPYNNSNLIYSITDNSTSTPYIFLYSAEFKFNEDPQLHLPDYFELNKSVPFLYNVNATSDDGLEFSDNTAMFDISEGGVILFIPYVEGDFPVVIKAKDTFGNYDEKEVLFVVREP